MITPEMVGRMLNTVGEGLAIFACVWLALRCFKPLNSGTRFAVWFSTLAVIVALPFVVHSTAAAVVPSAQKAPLTFSSSWALYFFTAWAAIASMMLVRLSLSLWHIHSLRCGSQKVDVTDLDPELQSAWAEASSRNVELRASDKMRVPAALGFVRPAVIVPTWTLRELPTAELRIILLHELAHIRRWDDWTNLAQKLVKVLFFFHPAVWWIESHLSLEREMACDDVVLAQTTNPKAYARSLLTLAERVGLGKSVALAQAALGRAHQTAQRIRQILDSNRPKATGIWKPAMGLVTAMSALALLAVPYTPRLVSFADHKLAPVPVTTAQFSDEPLPSPTPVAKKTSFIRPFHRKEMEREGASRRPAIAAEAKPLHRTPVAIQAGLKQAPEMVVVMRAVQYDQDGVAVWTLTVWQVSNSKAAQKQLHPEQIANSL
jgi:beta-lactamase regulating signal transducer with metallopeptidase domain